MKGCIFKCDLKNGLPKTNQTSIYSFMNEPLFYGTILRIRFNYFCTAKPMWVLFDHVIVWDKSRDQFKKLPTAKLCLQNFELDQRKNKNTAVTY